MMNVNDNAVSSATQCQMILDYMREHGSITPLEALEKPILCMRLGARIWDLKHKGYRIRDERIQVASGKYVKKYMLENEETA